MPEPARATRDLYSTDQRREAVATIAALNARARGTGAGPTLSRNEQAVYDAALKCVGESLAAPFLRLADRAGPAASA